MKRMFVLFAIIALSSSLLTAQQTADRKNHIGVNPLGLLFKIYSGEYGRYIDNGTAEINVPFFYWAPTSDLSIVGIGAKYRWYKDKNNEGIFYGGGLALMSVSWDYSSWSSPDEKITAVTFEPQGEFGYRWRWDSGFTLAPSLTLGYVIGTVESKSGEKASYGSAGASWGLNLGLAYEF